MKMKMFWGLIITVACMIGLTGCRKDEPEESAAAPAPTITVDKSDINEDTTEGDMSSLEAVGDLDVDKGIFDVTLTIPKDFVGDTTQEKLDQSAGEKGYKSATLNADGSITYVITRAQHKEMMDGIRESINNTLYEMSTSGDYPNICKVEANDDYTAFTVTVKGDEVSMMDSMSVLGLYMAGGMYAAFNGTTVDNIHVDFVSGSTGAVISSANSKDMGKD